MTGLITKCLISGGKTEVNHHSPVLDRANVQVNKPAEGVLVHGIYVSQIGDGEEQRSRVIGNRSVAFS